MHDVIELSDATSYEHICQNDTGHDSNFFLGVQIFRSTSECLDGGTKNRESLKF